MTQRLQIAKADVLALFDEAGPKLYGRADLAAILEAKRSFWRLTARTNVDDFIAFLRKQDGFHVYEFPFPTGSLFCFGWGSTTWAQAALSLKPRSYLSHYTAVRSHGLTEQLPKTLYVTYELPPPPISKTASLSQDAITAAFAKPLRTSSMVAELDRFRVQLTNGKAKGQVGVDDGQYHDEDTGQAVPVRITGLERTLIDITVRPVYAGGVPEVLKAFENARDRVSTNRLLALLRKLEHAYPFHQAIGFYLERAGFKSAAVDLFRKVDQVYDFFLDHDMGETAFVPGWRLHVPKGLEL